MNAITPLTRCSIEETDAEQRQRLRAYTYELAEINMQAARVAGQRIAQQHLDGTADQARASADPTLALSRATRGVTTAINAELRVTHGKAAAPQRAPASDPRRAPLRDALLPAANAGADPATLRREINARIEDALLADPNAEISLPETFADIADSLGLIIDLSKVSDEILGMPPRRNPAFDPPGPEPPHP